MWIEIIKYSKEIVGWFISENRKDKESLSKLFSDISSVIIDVADNLEKDTYPYYSCSIMETLSKSLYEKSVGILSEDESKKFEELLFNASKLEREFARRKELGIINELRITAGEFKGLSMLL
jgi:hypothetical protein